MASSSAGITNGSSLQQLLLSQSEREFIQQGCHADCRSDGRSTRQFRTYYITPGPLRLSHGSSRLVSADGQQQLQLLCSVKAELVQPTTALRPRAGFIDVSIDGSCGGSSKNTAQLRQVQAALHRVPWMDLERLCVVPGAAVWRLHVDLLILSSSSAGSCLLDAASHCIGAALRNTCLPNITVVDDDDKNHKHNDDSATRSNKKSSNVLDRLLVDSDIHKARPIFASSSTTNTTSSSRQLPEEDAPPIIVTVHVIRNYSNSSSSSSSSSIDPPVLVLDATPEEEAVSTAAIHVALRVSLGNNRSGTNNMMETRLQKEETAVSVCSVWKSGSGSLPLSLLPACVQVAVSAASVAVQHYKDVVVAARESSSAANGIMLQAPLVIQ